MKITVPVGTPSIKFVPQPLSIMSQLQGCGAGAQAILDGWSWSGIQKISDGRAGV